MKSNQPNICPRCGETFTCGMDAGQASCWCAELPALKISEPDSGCYCPACLKQLIAAQREIQEDR